MKSGVLVLAAILNTGVLLSTCGNASAQNQRSEIVFRVIDDANKGVFSEIVLEKSGSQSHFKDTGPDGTMKVNHTCQEGERFFAKAMDSNHYRDSTKADCGSPLTLKVTSNDHYETLKRIGDRAVQANDHGKAALAYNDLYVRTSTSDPVESEGFRVKALTEAGKSLNVEVPTVQDDGYTVMSPSLKTTLTDFQRKSGIEAKGQLDYPTLRSLAGTDIGVLVGSAK